MAKSVEILSGDLWQEWAQSCMKKSEINNWYAQGYPTSEDLRTDGVSIYVFITKDVTKERMESIKSELRAERDVAELCFKVCPANWFEPEILTQAQKNKG